MSEDTNTTETPQTPAVGDTDIFADAPIHGMDGMGKKVIGEVFGSEEPGEKQSYINAPTDGDIAKDDPDFTTHEPTGGAPPPQPKQGPDNAPAEEDAKLDGTPENRRNRVWRRAVEIVVMTDSLISGGLGILHDRDPKEFAADKDEIRRLCNSWYDALMEWGADIQEEVGLLFSYVGVYGWDLGSGVIKMFNRWNNRRKEKRDARKAANEKRPENRPAKSDPDPVGTNEGGRADTTKPVRVCKLPGCKNVLGDRQPHFCSKAHNLQYQNLRKKDDKAHPTPDSLEYTLDKDGKKVSVK